MEIRKARTEDLKEIRKLYRSLFEYIGELQPQYFRGAEQDESFIREILEGEKGDVLIAEEKGEILGFALVQEQLTPPYSCLVPHRYTYLMDLAVSPCRRGQGIGRALLKAVREWAAGRGSDYVELGVLTQNERAIRLYQSEGFEECMKTMRIKP